MHEPTSAATLRGSLSNPGIVTMPGLHDCLMARLVAATFAGAGLNRCAALQR